MPMTLVAGEACASLAPGLYPDVPDHIYHSWPLASNSKFSSLKNQSVPAKVEYEMRFGRKETDALRLGRMIHFAILQPEIFQTAFVFAEQCSAKTKEGKPCSSGGKFRTHEGRWFCGTHKPKNPEEIDNSKALIEPDEFSACMGALNAVWENELAADLLGGPGQIEYSGIYDDPEVPGLRIKFRLDKWNEEWGAIVDVKSTDDASPLGFANSIEEYGYHRQSAVYTDGAIANGLNPRHFIFIAVEKKPSILQNGKPGHAMGIYRIQDDSIALGRLEVLPHKQTYRRCEESGVWPGLSSGIVDLSLSYWSANRIRQQAGKMVTSW